MSTGSDVADLPLLSAADSDAPLAWYDGRFIGRREYLAHVAQAAARLPERGHAVNLCNDRYHFMVGLGALLLRGQVNLLPPNHAPQVIDEIAAEYDAYCLVDQSLEGIAAPTAELDFTGAVPAPERVPLLPAAQTAVVLFTSGSTGRAKPTPKSWGQLVGGTEIALRRLGLDLNPAQLVATVPAQHSYGLESTVLYAMLSACTVHAGRPFYAEDVRAALAEVPAPRVLVTTPVHLRACTEAGLQWPETAFVLSATAPLPEALARGAEQAFGCPVHEIYGCSEAGALASRRTLDGPVWQPYESIRIGQGAETCVEAPHLPGPQPLADALKTHPDGRFELLGRTADMLNIAGKRGSLQDLNQRLLSIDGVEDGAFLLTGDDANSRLAALVVAPGLDRSHILGRLRRALDPVFLPRPLVMVDALPRNATGKLTRQAMLELLARHRDVPGQNAAAGLLGPAPAAAPLLWHQGHEVTRSEFIRHARALAATLPEA
ncbi:MAG: AMP-binding protein [Acidihalobacter sp.]